jgi:hypothetical protein
MGNGLFWKTRKQISDTIDTAKTEIQETAGKAKETIDITTKEVTDASNKVQNAVKQTGEHAIKLFKVIGVVSVMALTSNILASYQISKAAKTIRRYYKRR